jgi:hypothetical protein
MAPSRQPLREISAPNTVTGRDSAGRRSTGVSVAAEWARKNDEVISRIVLARQRQQALLSLPIPAPVAAAGPAGAAVPAGLAQDDLDGVSQLLSVLTSGVSDLGRVTNALVLSHQLALLRLGPLPQMTGVMRKRCRSSTTGALF